MNQDNMFTATTEKENDQFVKDLGRVAKKYGFIIHNEEKMELANTFGSHGVDVAENFDLHMIQLCKPEKAAASLMKNPERAILMPKFIMTFSKDGMTQIRFFKFSQENIKKLVDDEDFPDSLLQTYNVIEDIIEEAK